MDARLTEAARALGRGDALFALKLVALHDDGLSLALRGTALAQLGELDLAHEVLRRARRKLGAGELAGARCAVAEAEVAWARRELALPVRALEEAQRVLAHKGDALNAAHARLVLARRALVLGRIADAEALLEQAVPAALPPTLTAIAELARAELALRRVRARDAAAALERAERAAQHAHVPVLVAEIDAARAALRAPAARLIERGACRLVELAAVESLLAEPRLIVDGCAHAVRLGARAVKLARRPVLFALASALAEAAPLDVSRQALIARAFEVQRPNASHRARLRVEIGRLRASLRGLAELHATPAGFRLSTHAALGACALAPPLDGASAAVRALLADGARWSTAALSLALGTSQRSVQRALAELEVQGHVRSIGKARAQRWLAPSPAGFATALLLPG